MLDHVASRLSAFARWSILGVLLASLAACGGGGGDSGPPPPGCPAGQVFSAGGDCCDTECGPCGDCSTGTCVVMVAGRAGSPTCTPFVCDGVNSTCPSACDADEDCGSCGGCDGVDPDTSASTCVSYAAGDRGAPSCTPYVCDGTNAVCPETCDVDADCGACGTCVAGACQLAAVGSSGSPSCLPYLCDGVEATCPASCSSDATCGPCGVCTGGACALRTAGSAGSPSCNPYVCDGASNLCPSTCIADAECGPCGICNAGACEARADGNPGSPSCAPYLCNGTAVVCPGTCLVDADCTTTHYCRTAIPRLCTAKQASGTSCSANNQCISGICAATKSGNQCQ